MKSLKDDLRQNSLCMRSYFKLIPVVLLIAAVIYFYTVFSKGISLGTKEIKQMMTLRDLRLIMNAIQEEYLAYRRFPDSNELKTFIEEKVVLKDRFLGANEPWKDVWGTPFRFHYSSDGKVILQSAGPDRQFSEYDPLSEEVLGNPALLGDDISYFTTVQTILDNFQQSQQPSQSEAVENISE